MATLNEIANLHNDWINIVKSFGARHEAEDVVQDMYLKIDRLKLYPKLSRDGVINKSYIWLVLRSVYYDSLKHSKRLNFIELSEHVEIKHDVNDYDMDELIRLEEAIDDLDWYDKKVLNIYIDGKSMRQISKETKIGLRSIFGTIKHCKEQIRRKL